MVRDNVRVSSGWRRTDRCCAALFGKAFESQFSALACALRSTAVRDVGRTRPATLRAYVAMVYAGE